MTGGIKIPGAVGALHVTGDLRAGQITCHVDVDAPRTGKPTTRVNWLVRQLNDSPASDPAPSRDTSSGRLRPDHRSIDPR